MVFLTSESVVFSDFPPGPLDLKTSTLIWFGSMWTSTSSASGRTATVTVEVWILPLDSVTGTLWTLCTPVSYTHLRAHETGRNLVCRLLLEKKNKIGNAQNFQSSERTGKEEEGKLGRSQ